MAEGSLKEKWETPNGSLLGEETQKVLWEKKEDTGGGGGEGRDGGLKGSDGASRNPSCPPGKLLGLSPSAAR